jgi:hypothetical protein
MLFFVSGGIFLNSSPEFGGTHSAMDKKRYAASANHVSGKFQNILPTDMSMSARDMAKTMYVFVAWIAVAVASKLSSAISTAP